jgi:hypothetical protein
MSINESIMQQLATLEKSAAEQMSAISEMRKALGLGELALPASASSSGKVKKARKSKKTAKAEEGSEGAESGAEQPKEKGPPSAWNVLVATTVAEMKQSGWPAWTDLKGVEWPASRQSTVKDKSGAEHEAYVFDGGDHDGKEPSPALGGMVRASYLKAQSDPVAAEKARKYHEKLAEKRSGASSTGSGEKGEPVADAEGAPKKGGGRPKMTEEQKAAAKVKREAKKAAEAKAEPKAEEAEEFAEVTEAPAAAPVAAAPAPAKKASVLKPKAAAPKKLDLSFFPWTFEGKNYITNDRKDVIEPEEGQWVGRFDGTTIDTSVPEPSDLDGVEMRE